MTLKKKILILGSSGLIGGALCKSLIKQNFLILVDKKFDIKQKDKLNSVQIKLDITKSANIKKIIDICTKLKVDSVIFCAYPKSNQWGTKFGKLKLHKINEDINNQLGVPLYLGQEVINFFKKKKGGNLIYLSSIQGVSAPKFEHYKNTNMTSPIEYSAVKAGIISITRYMAKFCKNMNIRVNCISPGGIKDNQNPKFLKRYKSNCLNKGMLDTKDIVGTIEFLLSDESKYINGQNIIIDDGWTL